MSRLTEYTFRVAAVGLTLISVTAGFEFYHALFGIATAVLCCLVFEALRLACLWSLVAHGWSVKALAIPIYGLVTITCVFASLTSFQAGIIKRHAEEMKPLESEIARRIALIKRTYAAEKTREIEELDQQLDRCNRGLALNPDSKYWRNRAEQLTNKRDRLGQERDLFLQTTQPQDNATWIERNAAMLDLELEPLDSSPHGSRTTTAAIQELWNVTELRAKKIVSILIVISVEAGIVLLSLLAGGPAKENRSIAKTQMGDQYEHLATLNTLRTRFEQPDIQGFLKRAAEIWEAQGRLPYSRELGKKQREVRKFFADRAAGEQELLALVKQGETVLRESHHQ